MELGIDLNSATKYASVFLYFANVHCTGIVCAWGGYILLSRGVYMFELFLQLGHVHFIGASFDTDETIWNLK